MPSQVIGSGVDTEPINTGVNTLPHASVILAGKPGSTAWNEQDTVDDPAGGAVSVPLKSTV